MKDLPSVTAFSINENLNNCQERFYSNTKRRTSKTNITKKINSIFSANNHVYKSRVLITFTDYEEEKIIVGKTATHLITIDGEKINILNIIDIEKI